MKNKLYLIVGLILTYGILVTGVLAVSGPSTTDQAVLTLYYNSVEWGRLEEEQAKMNEDYDSRQAVLEEANTSIRNKLSSETNPEVASFR